MLLLFAACPLVSGEDATRRELGSFSRSTLSSDRLRPREAGETVFWSPGASRCSRALLLFEGCVLVSGEDATEREVGSFSRSTLSSDRLRSRAGGETVFWLPGASRYSRVLVLSECRVLVSGSEEGPAGREVGSFSPWLCRSDRPWVRVGCEAGVSAEVASSGPRVLVWFRDCGLASSSEERVAEGEVGWFSS